MFTKPKEIARGNYRVTVRVIDWEAVGVVAFWGGIIMVILVII